LIIEAKAEQIRSNTFFVLQLKNVRQNVVLPLPLSLPLPLPLSLPLPGSPWPFPPGPFIV
jgi:hypothetical protein